MHFLVSLIILHFLTIMRLDGFRLFLAFLRSSIIKSLFKVSKVLFISSISRFVSQPIDDNAFSARTLNVRNSSVVLLLLVYAVCVIEIICS